MAVPKDRRAAPGPPPAPGIAGVRRVAGAVLAAAILHLVLVQPNHPQAMTPEALLLVPLELPVILLALVAVGAGAAGRALRVVLVAALLTVAVLKLADYTMFTALARGFNPVGDLPLVVSAWQLGAGAIGVPGAAAVVAGVALACAAAGLALWWATGVWARLRVPGGLRLAAAGGAGLAALVAVAEIGQAMGRWDLPARPPGAAFTARVAAERVVMIRETWADLQHFRAAAEADPMARRGDLLSALDRDLLVIFVESYGRASHDGALYAPTHRETLAAAEAALRDAGLESRSAFLTAPTRGGQSWLSHASLATGLWTDDQSRYLAALASGRRGLFHIAQDAGLQTLAVMPAITLDWPEAERMGFDTVLAADDLGYAGQPFNWVTMPDQFTLAALDRVRQAAPAGSRPLVAQVALISSHAPWVPVPTMVPWDAVGDGRIFDAMAAAGDPPEVVWRDRDRVRAQYRDAVDYALEAAFGFAARQAGPDAPVMLILGDHPAADFVAQDDRAEVPVHVVAPPEAMARMAHWGWDPGLLPDADRAAEPMTGMRDRILDAFSPATEPAS